MDKSCYDTILSCDIFILIIGGKYGHEHSDETSKTDDFYDKYTSITRSEFHTAIENDIPVYILIENLVHVEYQTYLANIGKLKINYKQVDSVNIYEMIKEIYDLKRNNPVRSFDHFNEAEEWLKNQWAGLFQGFLNKRSSEKQLSSLSSQVTLLSETNKTFKLYLETLMKTSNSPTTDEIINQESERLKEADLFINLYSDDFASWFLKNGIPPNELLRILKVSSSVTEFVKMMNKVPIPVDSEGNQNAFFINTVKDLNQYYDEKKERLHESLNILKMELGLEAVSW